MTGTDILGPIRAREQDRYGPIGRPAADGKSLSERPFRTYTERFETNGSIWERRLAGIRAGGDTRTSAHEVAWRADPSGSKEPYFHEEPRVFNTFQHPAVREETTGPSGPWAIYGWGSGYRGASP